MKPRILLEAQDKSPLPKHMVSWTRGWDMAELFPESKTLLFPGLLQSILRRACEHAEPGEEKTEVSDSCDIQLHLEQMVGKP